MLTWLQSLGGSDSFYKAILAVVTFLVSHFVAHMSWADSYNAAITAYVGGSLVIPPKTPAA